MTDEELHASVHEHNLHQLYPKRYLPAEEKIDPAKAKKLVKNLYQPEPKLTGAYERSIKKSYRDPKNCLPGTSGAPRSGKKIPQLGEQKNQSCPPLKVTSDLAIDPDIAAIYEQDAIAHGMSISRYLSQLQQDHQFNEGDQAYKYKYGEPLVRPEEVNNLPTYMRRVHKWYMKAAQEGRVALTVGVRDEHYFRGNDEVINVDFEELFQLYHQEALDKTIVSCYCL